MKAERDGKHWLSREQVEAGWRHTDNCSTWDYRRCNCEGVPPPRSTYNQQLSVKIIVAWYDLWVGVYIDKMKRRIFIFPIPCLGIQINLAGEVYEK